MHIVFLNPQGNFDANDSYLTEHPDFGGQLVYVKEVAQAMVKMGHKVDIVTRKIVDPDWPEFASAIDGYSGYEDSLRILRFSCGGPGFLEKERLWPYMDEMVAKMLAFYGDELPDFATAHYADGGYCAAQAEHLAGIGFTFTGHSLGAQKLDNLSTTLANIDVMDARFQFTKRIAAERLAMQRAARVITSTRQEQEEQYAHPLYHGAIDATDTECFAVIPPGVNIRIFSSQAMPGEIEIHEALTGRLGHDKMPAIVISGRMDEKKNVIGVVTAYSESEALRRRAALVLCVRGIDDPFNELDHLPEAEQEVLRPILSLIDEAGIREKVHFLNIPSQLELAATYRYFAKRDSVFALTAFYEPFGLAPIEAAACGLAPVVTKNGGPTEIFADGSGVLVDPFHPDDITRGLLEGLNNYGELSKKAIRRVHDTYTWRRTAEGYLSVIEAGLQGVGEKKGKPASLDATSRIMDYLGHA